MRRGLVLVATGAVLVAGPLLLADGPRAAASGTGEAPPPLGAVQLDTEDDSANVTELLDAVRGANALQCQLGLRTLDFNFGWSRSDILPDGAPRERELVAWATRRIDDPVAVGPLREALGDPDDCVQRVAVRLLGRMRVPQAVAALRDALRSTDPRRRRLGALGVGFSEQRGVEGAVLAALDDADAGVRAAAAWALGHVGSHAAIEPLARVLRADADPSVRQAAAWALGALF